MEEGEGGEGGGEGGEGEEGEGEEGEGEGGRWKREEEVMGVATGGNLYRDVASIPCNTAS